MSQDRELTVHVSTYLTDKEALYLKVAAKRDGRSVAGLIRKMIMDAMRVHPLIRQ